VPAGKKSEKRIKKENYWKRLWDNLEKFNKGLVVDVDNVSSKQISFIRRDLRKIGAVMVMGKNTLIKAALNHRNKKPEENDDDYEERKDSWAPLAKIEVLPKLFRGNVGIILTNGDVTDIKAIIEEHKREAPARIGQISQDDVWIRAGPTGLDPKQIAFFQNLNIPTKIVKTQIDILNDKKVIEEGDKIGSSEAALLEKLNIRPFSYKMMVKHVYEDGQIYDKNVLNITSETILNKLKEAIRNLSAASLEAGVPIAASAPHSLLNAFKNLVGITFVSDATFPQAEKVKSAAASAPTAAAATTSAGPAAAAEPEKEEEEENVDMGGLFGDDDY
jgi:large subunit ribosomal protein LP0